MDQHFLNENHKGFIENTDICSTDKTQSCDPRKGNIIECEGLRPSSPLELTPMRYIEGILVVVLLARKIQKFVNQLFELLFIWYVQWLFCCILFV